MSYTYFYYILLAPLPFWLLLSQFLNVISLLSFFNGNELYCDESLNEITNETTNKIINEKKYEDKFLSDIRKLNKEYIFNEKENQLLEEKKIYFLNILIDDYQNRKKEIESNISEIELLLKNPHCIDDEDDEDDEFEVSLSNKKNKLNNELKELEEFLESENGKKDLLFKSEESARNFIISQRIEKLANCYVMETTPQGNVLMIYDKICDSFKYYSDNTIPYRYLEVVGRKYVKFFDCRPLYVDMEEELTAAEEKWEKERIEKEKKLAEKDDTLKKIEKKSVFTKFKSYNKEGITGRVNKGVPPKNSISITKEQENQKILLKEKANRYTYEGKFANFNFLKKIERKVVDKKYGLSFADFKKIQNTKI